MAGSKYQYNFNYRRNAKFIDNTIDKLRDQMSRALDPEVVDRLASKEKRLVKIVENLPEPDSRGLVKLHWAEWQILDSAARAGESDM